MELPSPRLSGQLRKPGRASSAAPDSHPKSLSTKDLLCSSQSEKSSKALIKISVFREMPGYVVDEVSNSKSLAVISEKCNGNQNTICKKTDNAVLESVFIIP